ncbi:AN1-type zinc finger protein 4 isoform X2 [Perognathus longimembris pacificus]|uniref:AN1-type zinc finger protein 4 isoform X2 n=1 Tax=Perognathus longimembris pacificus TaxID=214514 RepID=UPI002019DC15|nr:AN1-type zinc finger protein 4 isoform X2 [Perognathus longimembris pacificus]
MFKADSGRTGIQLHTPYSRGIRKAKVMDNRKEPPFFNEDNVGEFYYKIPLYDTMELFIETLTGTCFELRVSPFEAVISVKAKIQRLEGIPICQQHLIWNNMELEDEYCLNDYNISEGCTLKLVLAMRGGPINTRKVPMEDPLREMAEYMDSSRDEVWEKTSCNKQVTFLVYREGDQLNFFRVVDRGDGTLTPLSESLSGGSVYNLYTDEDEEAEPSPSGQQIIENSITMNKMKLLKAKMETMNLSKKPKKVVKVKPRPPVAPRPSSNTSAAARHRLLRVLPHIGQPCPPPPAAAPPPEAPRSSGVTIRSPADRLPSAAGEMPRGEEPPEREPRAHPRAGSRPASQAPRAESGPDRELADCVFHLGSSLPRRTKAFSGTRSPGGDDDPALAPSPDARVPAEPPPAAGPGSPPAAGGAAERWGGLDGTNTDERGVLIPEAHANPGPKAASGDLHGAPIPHKSKLLSPLRCAASASLHSALLKQPRPTAKAPPCAPQSARRPLDARAPEATFPRTPRLRAVKVDSPGKRPDVISKGEARDITEMANKASKEPVGCVNNIGFFVSLARSTSRDSVQSTRGSSRLRPPTMGLASSLQHFQEDAAKKSSPQGEPLEGFLSARGSGMNGNNAAAGKRIGECTHHLPPVKASLQTKKKTTKHCFLCGKKTGLATSYECRQMWKQLLCISSLCRSSQLHL